MSDDRRIVLHSGRTLIGQRYEDTGEVAVDLLELLADEAIQVQRLRERQHVLAQCALAYSAEWAAERRLWQAIARGLRRCTQVLAVQYQARQRDGGAGQQAFDTGRAALDAARAAGLKWKEAGDADQT